MPNKSKWMLEPSSSFRGVSCIDCKQIERDAEDYAHWTFFIAPDGYYRFRCATCSELLRRPALGAFASRFPSP